MSGIDPGRAQFAIAALVVFVGLSTAEAKDTERVWIPPSCSYEYAYNDKGEYVYMNVCKEGRWVNHYVPPGAPKTPSYGYEPPDYGMPATTCYGTIVPGVGCVGPEF